MICVRNVVYLYQLGSSDIHRAMMMSHKILEGDFESIKFRVLRSFPPVSYGTTHAPEWPRTSRS